MDGKANLPVRSDKNLDRPINPDTTSSSSSSFSSSSPPDFLRRVQAAVKRHRPLGTIQSNSIRPRRMLVPQREASRSCATNLAPAAELKSQDAVSLSQAHSEKYSISQSKSSDTVAGESQEDGFATPPSLSGVTIRTADQDFNLRDAHKYHSQLEANCKDKTDITSLQLVSQQGDGQKQVQFSAGGITTSQGADVRMATGLENLSTHLSSLALTEIDWAASNQLEASTIANHEMKNQNFQNTEAEVSFRSDGGVTALMPKRSTAFQDQLQQFRKFGQLPIQSSVVGPSCATTTSIYSASAPVHNSTTCYSHSHRDVGLPDTVEQRGDLVVNPHSKTQGTIPQMLCTSIKDSNRMSIDQTAVEVRGPECATDSRVEIKEYHPSKAQKCSVLTETVLQQQKSSILCDNSSKGKESGSNANNPQPQIPLSKSTSTDEKLETSKMERQEKAATKNAAAPRKKSYDPDLFFKVNGKLYQRLGKIGSGGSSEVHKVISSDCTIYALKKIKLKGRDYATAYGFCQEIEYLSRLKGKDHIIQLIDYEVTDKALLQEVMKGSLSNKDGRVKDDGYIYMVLEYGEIDLAHMLSQKWKELDGCNQTIDENWLRFYWQQILQAVNTIHEERIVHSDLKPANFLLVKGSLKLIDFGIAKAIMSDTTNIQRDSQVGTLSYMSPEAFMCNEKDANGNVIKCGRPSDIWSLGCILYQMVYGRTPFSEYKTFWAKLKVITDPNHNITYELVSNPWLLDLMKKCLAWDRNERWRIPELLKHPFLVPPVPHQLPQNSSCDLLQHLAESCRNDTAASKLCCELQQMFCYPKQTFLSSESQNQWCLWLSQISKLSCELQERLRNSEK